MLYCKYYTDDDKTIEFHIVDHWYNDDGMEEIIVRAERGDKDFIECRLPACNCYKSFGFSEDELLWAERFIKDNSRLIFDMAREGMEIRA